MSMDIEKQTGKIYIAKPTKSQQNPIILIQKFNAIPKKRTIKYVVQEYIPQPLLIDGTKFDLRLYVVITSIDPLTAYICKEGMARICTAKYETPKPTNFKNVCVHLTNSSQSKKFENYKLS